MTKRENLKKSFSFMTVIIMALVLVFATVPVQAVSNPLSKMPTKFSGVVHKTVLWKGANYITPYYNSKVTIKVKSSNPKVAKVKGEAYAETNWETGKKEYAAGYTITPVSAGTAKIYVKVTVKGKTYSKTCTVKSYKWESPITNLKIGSTSYQSKLNKSNLVHTKRKIISGKVYYKVKRGFNVKVYANYYSDPKNKFSVKSKVIKSGQSLPKNTFEINVMGTSKKNKLTYVAEITK